MCNWVGGFGFGLDIRDHNFKFSDTDCKWRLWKNFGSNPIAKFLYLSGRVLPKYLIQSSLYPKKTLIKHLTAVINEVWISISDLVEFFEIPFYPDPVLNCRIRLDRDPETETKVKVFPKRKWIILKRKCFYLEKFAKWKCFRHESKILLCFETFFSFIIKTLAQLL